MSKETKDLNNKLFDCFNYEELETYGESDLESAQRFVNQGADVNYQKNNRSLLYIACVNADENAVKWLLKHGADIDKKVFTIYDEGSTEGEEFRENIEDILSEHITNLNNLADKMIEMHFQYPNINSMNDEEKQKALEMANFYEDVSKKDITQCLKTRLVEIKLPILVNNLTMNQEDKDSNKYFNPETITEEKAIKITQDFFNNELTIELKEILNQFTVIKSNLLDEYAVLPNRQDESIYNNEEELKKPLDTYLVKDALAEALRASDVENILKAGLKFNAFAQPKTTEQNRAEIKALIDKSRNPMNEAIKDIIGVSEAKAPKSQSVRAPLGQEESKERGK